MKLQNVVTNSTGDHINALLASVGYNFRKRLRKVFSLIQRLVGWLNPVATAA
jgi:hypothetical protein